MYLFSFLIVVCRKGKRILIERKQSSFLFSFFVIGFRDCDDIHCVRGDTYIPEFLKTGLAKIRAHSTTWQLKAIKSVQRPIKKAISDAEQ